MPTADSYQSQLREALVGAVETKLVRQHRRAVVRRAAFAVVAVAAVVATIVTVTLPNNRADASLDVEVRDGSVSVRLLDLENRPEEIVAALRNAGIQATVDTVPVGPSNVGRFISFSGSEGAPVPSITEGTKYSFAAFSVPQGVSGVVKISLGRRANPGERWIAGSNAMAKGEVFACQDLFGLTATEAARRASDGHATARWLAIPDGTLESATALSAPYASWRVVEASSYGPGDVLFYITVDGRWPFLIDAPPRVDPSCEGK